MSDLRWVDISFLRPVWSTEKCKVWKLVWRKIFYWIIMSRHVECENIKTTLPGDFNYFDKTDWWLVSVSRRVSCSINIPSSTKPSIVMRLSRPSRATRAARLLSCLDILTPADLFLLLPITFITLIWFATLILPVTTVFTDCWKLMLSADQFIMLFCWERRENCFYDMREREDVRIA